MSSLTPAPPRPLVLVLACGEQTGIPRTTRHREHERRGHDRDRHDRRAVDLDDRRAVHLDDRRPGRHHHDRRRRRHTDANSSTSSGAVCEPRPRRVRDLYARRLLRRPRGLSGRPAVRRCVTRDGTQCEANPTTHARCNGTSSAAAVLSNELYRRGRRVLRGCAVRVRADACTECLASSAATPSPPVPPTRSAGTAVSPTTA